MQHFDDNIRRQLKFTDFICFILKKNGHKITLLKIMSTTLVCKPNESDKPYNYIKTNPKYMGNMSKQNVLKATNTNEKIVRQDSSESEESSETILFPSLTPVDGERYVPKDLIPVDRRLMDYEWAKETYRYAHLFDINKFKSRSWETNE